MALLLLLTTPASAQRVEEALLISAAAADLVTTEWGLAHGFEEANPLGRNRAVRITTKAATTALIIILAREAERTNHPNYAKWMRRIGIGFSATAAGWNISLVVQR